MTIGPLFCDPLDQFPNNHYLPARCPPSLPRPPADRRGSHLYGKRTLCLRRRRRCRTRAAGAGGRTLLACLVTEGRGGGMARWTRGKTDGRTDTRNLATRARDASAPRPRPTNGGPARFVALARVGLAESGRSRLTGGSPRGTSASAPFFWTSSRRR